MPITSIWKAPVRISAAKARQSPPHIEKTAPEPGWFQGRNVTVRAQRAALNGRGAHAARDCAKTWVVRPTRAGNSNFDFWLQFGFELEPDRLRSMARAEFVHHIGAVDLDCARADIQFAGDNLVAAAFREPFEHFALAG